MPFNLNRFDLTTLRLLVAAVDSGSLSAGAERLGLSLPPCQYDLLHLPPSDQ